jgi:hypothetical protein
LDVPETVPALSESIFDSVVKMSYLVRMRAVLRGEEVGACVDDVGLDGLACGVHHRIPPLQQLICLGLVLAGGVRRVVVSLVAADCGKNQCERRNDGPQPK